MSAPVHILATCRKPELIRGTLLVFDTLRVGFPTASVKVHLNAPACEDKISAAARKAGCDLRDTDTIHHKWIEELLRVELEPFWILDTDVVFWESVEGWGMDMEFLSGTYTPRFEDPFTKCDTQPRLHTCLLYFDPVQIALNVSERLSRHAATPFNPCVNLIDPIMIPKFGKTIFYDTCSLLHHAIGGTPFLPEQLSCFEHLHCGTWSDLIEPAFPMMRKVHSAIFSDPQRARGLRQAQDDFYRRYAA